MYPSIISASAYAITSATTCPPTRSLTAHSSSSIVGFPSLLLVFAFAFAIGFHRYSLFWYLGGDIVVFVCVFTEERRHGVQGALAICWVHASRRARITFVHSTSTCVHSTLTCVHSASTCVRRLCAPSTHSLACAASARVRLSCFLYLCLYAERASKRVLSLSCACVRV